MFHNDIKIKNLPRPKINLKYRCTNNRITRGLFSCLFGSHLMYLYVNNCVAMDLLSCLFEFHFTSLCANNRVAMDLLSYLFGFYLIHLCANNRYAIGLLVEQGWWMKWAYPVYGTQRENKAVGLGLSNLSLLEIQTDRNLPNLLYLGGVERPTPMGLKGEMSRLDRVGSFHSPTLSFQQTNPYRVVY